MGVGSWEMGGALIPPSLHPSNKEYLKVGFHPMARVRLSGLNAGIMKTLEDLFLDRLAVIYDSELRLAPAIEQLAESATCSQLQAIMHEHAAGKRDHVLNLESVFAMLAACPLRRICEPTVALIYESYAVVTDYHDSPAINAALISIFQKMEHYEIASYGCLRDWASVLGHEDIVAVLQQILNHDKASNQELTVLARSRSNLAAMGGSTIAA